ncbi:MAG: putative GTP-binding protein EngB [Verrucomicrobiota bacterium]|jgi:GTP-binding protein
MKIISAEFLVSAPDLRSCPRSALPEFAFIGRSNVGKSSLINMLTERRDLAKVSKTPGKTKLINFFTVNGDWTLVDLPGYGYAQIGAQRRREFNEAVADFLEGRANLRRVFVLIDSRLPAQPIDVEFIQWLEGTRVPFAIIFTKIDKQSATQTGNNIAAFQAVMRTWRADLPPMFSSSSETRSGRAEILAHIAATVADRSVATA